MNVCRIVLVPLRKRARNADLFSIHMRLFLLAYHAFPLALALDHAAPGRALVVIGANDGTSGDNAVVLSWLRFCAEQTVSRKGLKVLLLEPNPNVFASLVTTVNTMYKANPSIVPVNALVGGGSGGVTPFYMVNATLLLQDCPGAPHWALHQLSSLSREQVHSQLRGFSKYDFRLVNARCDRSALQRHLLAKDAQNSKYIISRDVPSISFSQLLQDNQLTAQDVDVLAIDAQGFDAAILAQAFTELKGLFPRVVIFEHNLLSDLEKNSTIELLERKGYATDCLIHNKKAVCRNLSGQDVYATHTRRGLYTGVPSDPVHKPHIGCGFKGTPCTVRP